MAIAPGLVGEVELVVQPADTADALGNRGVHVLATPRLVALLELAAIRAVEPHLPPGAGTVGTRIDVRHLAATPVGMRAVSAPRSARSTAGASCSTSRGRTRRSGSWKARTSASRSTRRASSPGSPPRVRAARLGGHSRRAAGRPVTRPAAQRPRRRVSRRGRPGRGPRAWRGRARHRRPGGARRPTSPCSGNAATPIEQRTASSGRPPWVTRRPRIGVPDLLGPPLGVRGQAAGDRSAASRPSRAASCRWVT